MRKLFGRERVARDEPRLGAHVDVLIAFMRLLRFLDKPWAVVTHRKWLELIRHATGRRMSTRTLCRHLLWLEKNQVIARTQRHRRTRKGFQPRATLYTFGLAAPLWINRIRDAGAVPFGRLRVPKMAVSRNPSLSQVCPLCGQNAHTAGKSNRAPRDKRGGRRGPPASAGGIA